MKKWVVLIIACLFTNILSQTNVSPQFSELKGMEDQLGDTHLFYRIYSSWEDTVNYWINSSENIYHFNLSTGEDSLFLPSYYHNFEDFYVNDFTFWSGNPANYIYGGATQITILAEKTFIYRYDSDNRYEKNGVVRSIEASGQNDNLLYAGVSVLDSTFELTIKSTDGGWNWERLSDTYELTSLNPFNDQIFFAWDIMFRNIYKTTNGGISFLIVDSSMTYWEQQYHYDPDANHIYRVVRNFHSNNYELKVSSDGGEVFSWETKYTSPNKLFISNNSSLTGEIYLADKKNIFRSIDYGNNFTLYKTLERKIVGIYKKPNSNKLYAATKYKIYEITPDTVQVIKSLPIPEEVLNYYPLAVGNKWIYDEVTVVQNPYPEYYHKIIVKEVFGDTIAPNGKHYYKVNDKTIWESSVLERVDSAEGKVYRYYEDPSLPENEYLAYDLLAEIGDTISSYRMGFNTVMFTTMYAETMFRKWGMTKPKKVFLEYTLHPPIFSLTQNVGLDSIYSYFDFGNTWTTLKGCIINGIVYGDTTTVGVEDEENPIANEFKLEQNYPNPFNPSTKIKFTIPSVETTRRVVFTTLKVYDVLGNEIATLVNEEKPAGSYEIEFDSHSGLSGIRALPSGIYFYKLQAGNFIQTKKMVYLK